MIGGGEFDEMAWDLDDVDRHVIPDDLESIPVGPFLASILSTVDRRRLNGHDLIRVMKSRERLAAHFQAESLADMAEVARSTSSGPEDDPGRVEEVWEFSSMEIGSALRLTRRAADSRLDLALRLRDRLPKVWALFSQGAIDLPRARVLVDSTDHLPEQNAREVVDKVLATAPTMTTGQLRAKISRLCVEASPDEAAQRYERSVADRRVSSELNSNGTADFFALDLPPDRVAQASDHINRLARSLRGEGESRNIDQLRADVFLDLLTGGPLGSSVARGAVDVRVDLSTLAGLDEKAGEIPGMGPIIAEMARTIAHEQTAVEWRYSVVEDGQLIGNGVLRRSPDAAQRRRILARFDNCVAPGCRMPSSDCDIDHTVAYMAGGPTTDCNLSPICRYHHRAKHEASWDLTRLDDGDHEWTSPMSHTYLTSGRPP
jgi:hypothetical protein